MITHQSSHSFPANFALHRWSVLALTVFSLCGCGEQAHNATPSSTSLDSAEQDEFSEAFGGGQGGGTLTFNGTEYAIESAMCYLDPPVEVGTAGNGYRIVIGGTERYPSISILEGSTQWVAMDKTYTVTDSTVSAAVSEYRTVDGEQVAQASFVIECS